MIHKNCGGQICLDLTGLYILQSPVTVTNSRKLGHGMIEIKSAGKRDVHNSYTCNKCKSSFAKKEEFDEQILETCSVCSRNYCPSKILVSDFDITVCENCVKLSNSSKEIDYSARTGKLMSLYGSSISKLAGGITLLTLLMKK